MQEDHDSHKTDRYARQVAFSCIGRRGQDLLASATVAVIGCGALGSVAAEMLARAGVGTLILVDRDFVELTNLYRQILYDEADAAAGLPKAVAAARALQRINSGVRAVPMVADVTPANIEQIISGAEAVIDGTDNFETRYLLNDACVKLGIPWVYGGAIGATGMSSTILPGETACFRCQFPDAPPAGSAGTCETVGVLASIILLVSAIQCTETVKILIGAKEHLNRELIAFDLWSYEDERFMPLERRPDCPCCGLRRFEYLDARITSKTTSLCGQNGVQVSPGKPLKLDLTDIAERLASTGLVTTHNDYLVRVVVGPNEITVFADGRAIVKGTTDEGVARTLYALYVGI